MSVTVREVMTRNPVTLASTASIMDAARKMRDSDIGGIVVTEGKDVCGFVTDRDLVVRALADGKTDLGLGEVCNRDLVTASPDDPVSSVVDRMRDKAVRRILVMSDGKAEGVVSIGDLAIASGEKSALSDISAAKPNK